jgi:hypothetical protein
MVTTTHVSGLNQYEWMLLYGDELADAIREEGGLSGPKTDALLTELQPLECGGSIRQQAKKLLKRKLEYRGVGHLLNLGGCHPE